MRDLRWETLSKRYLMRDTWGTVRADRCRTADGKIIDPYYVYEFPTWVTAVALTREGKMLIERQYRHALDVVGYEIPGGCVDPEDDSLETAIRRELLEETGYSFSKYTYLGKTSANPSTNNNWMHMYLAEGGELVGGQHLDHGEEIDVYLFTIEEVQKLLAENQICQAMHVTALYYGLRALNRLA